MRGGAAGFERLQVLARERWPDTERFLERAGIGPGMEGIDLGCGGGAVTIEMARRVGPSGRMVGLDLDAVKLELARKAAVEQGVTNVEFRQGSIRDWEEPGRYDAVYSRFVLHHLSNPTPLLRRMWGAVREGGVLVVEDADHERWALRPTDPSFDFFRRTLMEVIRRSGGDPTFGRKLEAAFIEAGIPEPQTLALEARSYGPDGRQMPWNTLESLSDAAIGLGIATRPVLDDHVRRLREVLADPQRRLEGPGLYQVFARKGAGPPARSAPRPRSRER